MYDLLEYEKQLYQQGYRYICGIDEVGRGSLAGPVLAAAVVIDMQTLVIQKGINDSKKLTPRQRESLFEVIKSNCLDYAFGIVSADDIDRMNILEATFKSMRLAFDSLNKKPDFTLIDGRDSPLKEINQKSLIKGDTLSYSIASASILAKVTRDNIMKKLHYQYPEYDFINNKGYGTKKHREAILLHGRSLIHRSSFRIKEESI